MPEAKNNLTDEQVQRINQIQDDFFSGLIHVFDPPLPEGVPERLDIIVATAVIERNNVVLDVGSGTGILIPFIQSYKPGEIYACDLSQTMLDHLQNQYPAVKIFTGDVRDMPLPDGTIDVVFVNACYPNIADKKGSISNIVRIMKKGGRMVISHPMGKSFINTLRKRSPFPLDDFPDKFDAKRQFRTFGLTVETFVDEPELYILLLTKMV